MKKVLLVLVVMLAGMCFANARELPEISDKAEFYMITCEPGQESYTKFGHSAIRVVDKEQGLDVAFNWGVFSFETPNFIGRFVVGETDYELAVWSTDLFLVEYRDRGSAVHQFHINLDSTEKQTLWGKLRTNYEPKNRVYRYNFIYDNCATRVVDMILESYDSIDESTFGLPTMSYRKFVNTYTHSDNFMALGIDLVFGGQADKVVSAKESTTFPLQAMELLEGTTVKRDSVSEPILTNHIYLCNEKKQGAWREYDGLAATMMCVLPLAILAFMIVMFVRSKKYHYERISAQIVLWLMFALSLLILFLKYFTIHPLVNPNYNILWCSPLAGVLAIILLIRHRQLNMKMISSFIVMAFTLSMLCVLAIGKQTMDAPLFCWWAMVAVCEILIFLTYLSRFVSKIKLEKAMKRNGNKKQHHHHHHLHHHHHHHHQEENK